MQSDLKDFKNQQVDKQREVKHNLELPRLLSMNIGMEYYTSCATHTTFNFSNSVSSASVCSSNIVKNNLVQFEV